MMSKINSSLWKLSGGPNTTTSLKELVQQASTPGITPLKVVLLGLILDGSIPIFMDSVLIDQVKTVVAVDKDSSEIISVDDRIEYQGSRTSLTDTGWVIPTIKGDRTSQPWVEFWGAGSTV